MDQTMMRGLAVVIAVGAVAGVLAAAGLGALQVAAGSPAVVDSDRARWCAALSAGIEGRGQFPDPSGDDRRVGEVFTQTRTWIAWFHDGRSYPVTVGARVTGCGDGASFIGSPPDHVAYRFLYRERAGDAWQGFSQDDMPGGVFVSEFILGVGDRNVALPAFTFAIDGHTFHECAFRDEGRTFKDSSGRDVPVGLDVQCDRTGRVLDIAEGAALRVEVLVWRTGAPLGLGNYGPSLIAWDELELRYGVSSVSFSRASVKVGESVLVRWDVPTTTFELCDARGTCTARQAYFLEVRDMNTNRPLPGFERMPVTLRSGSASVPVTRDLFSTDLATCQNRLRALLFTDIVVADQEDTAVQADGDLLVGVPPPPAPTVVFDRAEYQEGDTVRVNWTVPRGANVSKYHVTAHIGGLPNIIDRDQAETGASFSAPRTGILEVQVTAYDRCQPSRVEKVEATVGNVSPGLCELFPEVGECGKEREASLLVAVLAALGVVVAFVVVGLVGFLIARVIGLGPLPSLLLAFLSALAVALAVALWFTGAGHFEALGG